MPVADHAAGASVEPTSGPPKGTGRARIALFGIFGIQNLGNECTLQATLHNVRERLPGAELYTICYEPRDVLRRHALPSVSVSARSSTDAISAPSAAGRNPLRRWLRILFRRIPGELREWRRAFRTLQGTDLLLMTGTGMLTDYNCSASGYPYDVLKWTVAGRLAGCKVRFVSIGVGPLHERLSRLPRSRLQEPPRGPRDRHEPGSHLPRPGVQPAAGGASRRPGAQRPTVRRRARRDESRRRPRART
jgi:hypothetical protein